MEEKLKFAEKEKNKNGKEEEIITKELIIEQLEELRRRIIIPIIVFIVCFIGSLPFSKKMLDVFLSQFKSVVPSFIFTNPLESFWVHVKVSAYFSLFISLPILIWQMWLFVSPALYPNERRLVSRIILGVIFLFLLGTLFCFFIVLPKSLNFLLKTFSSEKIQAMISISDFFSFVLKFSLSFGLAFQTPIIVMILIKSGLIERESLKKMRAYIIVLAFIVSAFITPTPDALTQTILAIPLIFLWELGILLSRFI